MGCHRSFWIGFPCVLGSFGGAGSQGPSPIPHLELLLLGQQVVVLIALVQGDQHVLEPVPHAQGELSQLCVQAGRDDWKSHMVVSTAPGHAAPDPRHTAPVPSHLRPASAWTFALPQPMGKGAVLRLGFPLSKGMAPLTFAGPNVVQVQLVSFLGSLQGALGGKEMAGGVIGLVVGAADLCRMGRCCMRDSEAQPCCEVSRESLQMRCLTCFLGWLTDPWSLLTEARWGPATLTLDVPPPSLAMSHVRSFPAPVHQAASALTFSKTPAVAGQLEGSWHTHMGELLSSTSHTLPCLQWWFWQGSGRGQGAKSEPAPSSPPTSCPGHLSTEGR